MRLLQADSKKILALTKQSDRSLEVEVFMRSSMTEFTSFHILRTEERDGTLIQAWAGHKGFRAKDACEDKQAAADDVQITLGADNGYDAQELVDALQELGVLPHIAQNKSGRRSAVPEHIAQTEGYAISQQKRKLIERGFGWAKLIGPIRQVMVRGLKKVNQLFVLTMAAYNLASMRTLGQVRQQATQAA
jgi:hypothetical protein